MRWFKKKDVPEELPNLVVDDVITKPKLEEKQLEKKSEISQEASPIQKLPTVPSSELNDKIKELSVDDESGYFKDLMKNVIGEVNDLDEENSWYKNKFLPGDIVFQMREYWEKQKPEILLKNIGGDLKNRLTEKTDKLHKLEKEWQEVYFHLLTKEEEIRKEEKELKESLSEFIDLIKHSTKRKEDE